jgi:hypothetical protein
MVTLAHAHPLIALGSSPTWVSHSHVPVLSSSGNTSSLLARLEKNFSYLAERSHMHEKTYHPCLTLPRHKGAVLFILPGGICFCALSVSLRTPWVLHTRPSKWMSCGDDSVKTVVGEQ